MLAPSPFVEPPAPRAPTLADRFLKRPQPERAEYELTRLLANQPIEEITPRMVSDLLSSFRLSGPDAHALLVRMWSRALERFLVDDVLSDAEQAYLTALRRLLDLGEDDIVGVERQLIHPRLQKVIDEILLDQTVSPEEREALARVGSALRVSPALQSEMFAKAATQLLQDMVEYSVADRRFSPDEAAEIKTAAANLGLDLNFDHGTQEELNRFALLWRIENGDLPRIAVRTNLGKDEVCHFSCRATSHEAAKRASPEGIEHHGESVRIARGIYYRFGGGSRPRSLNMAGMDQIDIGTVYITNKRYFFDGRAKKSSIKLQDIVAFEVFMDGLAIDNGSGRTPHFLLDGDAEIAAAILSRLLAKQ